MKQYEGLFREWYTPNGQCVTLHRPGTRAKDTTTPRGFSKCIMHQYCAEHQDLLFAPCEPILTDLEITIIERAMRHAVKRHIVSTGEPDLTVMRAYAERSWWLHHDPDEYVKRAVHKEVLAQIALLTPGDTYDTITHK